jgi:predicted molibdopterin-dependent oxidoreductase YjgC
VLVVQDIFLTPTAELADVVLPATASFAEADGTVTNSERRVQRVRRAVAPPAGARDDIAIIADLSRRLGRDLGDPTPEALWDELRALSPMHAGMSYARLDELGGIQWPCPDEATRARRSSTAGCGPNRARGRRRRSTCCTTCRRSRPPTPSSRCA